MQLNVHETKNQKDSDRLEEIAKFSKTSFEKPRKFCFFKKIQGYIH